MRQCHDKLSKKGNETSLADESSSCSEYDEREDMTPTLSHLPVRSKHHKRSFKDWRYPLLKSSLKQSPTSVHCVLATQQFVSRSPNRISEMLLPPSFGQSPRQQLVKNTGMYGISRVNHRYREVGCCSLDRDQLSKSTSTESEVTIMKEEDLLSTVTPEMRNFASTSSFKPSK